MLIHADTSCLIVIDMQERLVPAMQAPARTIGNARTLIAAATELAVPVLLTEQYPKGLGATVPELARAAAAAHATILPKMHFSCMEDQDFAAAFKATGRNQAVIAGMEAHICVLQTAVSLMDQGTEVFVVTDATLRRRHCHHRDGGLRVAGPGRDTRFQGVAGADQISWRTGF